MEFQLKQNVTYEITHNKETNIYIINMKIGVLNKNEITFETEENSEVMNLINTKSINILKESDKFEDIKTLYSLGFLNKRIGKKVLKLSDTEINDYSKLYDFFDLNVLKIFYENSDMVAINRLKEEKKENIKDFDSVVVLIKEFNSFLLISLNNLMQNLDIVYTVGFIDNSNLYVTMIDPRITGCYECLEKKILTKYSYKIAEGSYISEKSDLMLLEGFLNNVVRELEVFGLSTLYGNVFHINISTWETNFNFNKRTILCNSCSNRNKILFEEQNVRSRNLIQKENE